MKRFTREHEWVLIEGDFAVVGITEYAARELGEISFIELPDVGAKLAQGDPLGVVESSKTAIEMYSPVSGTVSEVNSRLEDKPEIINRSAEQDGWFYKLENFRLDEVEHLMTEDEYAGFIVG